MNSPGIIAKNITVKRRDQYVLHDVSFYLEQCDHLLITGESGSGKTMLALAIAGKLFHQGVISFFSAGKPIKPKLIYVEQHYHFKTLSNTSQFYYQQRFNSFDANDASTVMEELKHASGENFDQQKATELLALFDLLHCRQSPMTYLSSGEHKRFQLIRALLQQPDVLILDEPFIGLDAQSRKELKRAINKIADNGSTCILICKETDAPTCITHQLILDAGKMISIDPFTTTCYSTERHIPFVQKPLPELPAIAEFQHAFSLNDVSIVYGENVILNEVSWTVNKGERWLLKGHNGAGKSTLLSLLTGDNPQAYANDIYLFDKKRGSGESIWDIKKKIGFVSPELQWHFDNSTTCFDAVASGLFDTIGLFRSISKTDELKVNSWLAYFGLDNNANQLLSSLPAGKQRLTLLARAMVKNPPVLILDEPCQGLDEHQRNYFIQTIEALCNHSERTLIYVSHYAEDIPSCVDKVIELKKGKAEFLIRPHHKQQPQLQIHTV